MSDSFYWIEGLGYHFWLDAYNNDIGLRKFQSFNPVETFDPIDEPSQDFEE